MGKSDDFVGKNVYYLSISGVQKAIRRGNPDLAERLAVAAWRFDPFRLWRRCFSVMLEDVAPIPEVFDWLIQNMQGSKEEGFIREWVRILAAAPKSREIGSVATVFREKEVCLRLMPQEMKDLYDRGLGDGNFGVYGEAYPTHWVEFASKCWQSYDWEKQALMLPVLLAHAERRGFTAEAETVDVTPCPEADEIIEGVYPLAAADQHTWTGKQILESFWKKNEGALTEAGFRTAMGFGDSVWILVGAACKFTLTQTVVDYENAVVERRCGPVLPMTEQELRGQPFLKEFFGLARWWVRNRCQAELALLTGVT